MLHDLRGWHNRREACARTRRRWEVWPRRLCGHQWKLYKPGKISTTGERSGERWRMAEELQNVTPLWVLALYHAAKSWDVEKSLSCMRLAKVEKRGESKMIRCFEMTLTGLAKVKKQVETKMIWCLEIALNQTHEIWEMWRNYDDLMLRCGPVPTF